jgi:hypothetical protein
MCFVISGSNNLSLYNLPQDQAGSLYSSAPQRSNSASVASKRISADTNAKQKMMAAREAIMYWVMRKLLLMRDAGWSRERLERDTEQAAEPCFLLMLLRMQKAA